jgi:hypothetical protein
MEPMHGSLPNTSPTSSSIRSPLNPTMGKVPPTQSSNMDRVFIRLAVELEDLNQANSVTDFSMA